MATIYIDKHPFEVHEGQDLLSACLSLGFDLPYFCWHPAMHSVGACRQCAVKIFAHSNDPKGRLAMACMTPVKDGMHVSILDEEASAFRRSIIEWLMVNHPHDCPVCDEGGECHLQDMTVMTGHDYRRYRFKKRTHRNQDLGPFVTHEMNRCIQCYRCVRFYRDFAGSDDLQTLGWHDNVYFGRSSDGRLESEFTGNLVEVCPTGVFTDKTLARHYTRKWDLQTAPSVCVHCGLGCNTIPGERYGTLRRIHNRFNAMVNGYFLCDRGRYGYEFVNSPSRIRSVQMRRDGQMQTVESKQALNELAGLIGDGRRVIGIGSPRAPLEANYALRTLVGAEHFFSGLSRRDEQMLGEVLRVLRSARTNAPSLREIESADAVLVLGEDPTNSAPMLDYAIRQSTRQKSLKLADQQKIDRWHEYAVRTLAQDDRSPLFIVSPSATKLDRIASGTLRAAPADIAIFARAVAAAVENKPLPAGLSDRALELAPQIAVALKSADRPVVVSGTSCGSVEIIRAAAELSEALCRADNPCGPFLVAPECDSLGLAMMGARPLEEAHSLLKDSQADVLIVLENDLYRRMEAQDADALLSAASRVIVIDHTPSRTSARANVVLPAGTFAESDGTLVNNEGRAQRCYRVMAAGEPVRESWRWLRDIASAVGNAKAGAWKTFDDVVASMAADLPQLAGAAMVTPKEDFRIDGMRVPRQPHRYTGRTAMNADISEFEPQPPQDADSPLAFSMEGYEGQPPSPLLPRYWAGGWNSVQALNKFQQEVGSLLRQSMPGVRLIETTTAATEGTEGAEVKRRNGREAADDETARPFESKVLQGQWLLVPIWHIFGSEELSSLSNGIAELAPQPYVAMSPADAEALGAKEGQELEVSAGTWSQKLALKLRDDLPTGVAALPAGLRQLPFLEMPGLASIKPASKQGGGQ